MKKNLLLGFCVILCLFLSACGEKNKDYILNEDTFFLVMTNMQYYPEQYLDSEIEYDCFTYNLEDVNGEVYTCGVRKCSSDYGCTCGNDTIIGFILESDEPLPEPRNQREDSADKTWVHLKGKLNTTQKKDITIHSYLPDGSVDPEKTELISFLVFDVESCDLIEDYSDLKYYVTK